MALDPSLSRISKILVEDGSASFDEAQTTLRNLRLHVIVGASCTSPAAQAAVLTIVATGIRTFVGGVMLSGAVNLPHVTPLPLGGGTIGSAATELGSRKLKGPASQTILVGDYADHVRAEGIRPWWNGWRAGATAGAITEHDARDTNPLVGIAAGALAVASAFQTVRTGDRTELEVDLWPAAPKAPPPAFSEVFLPSSIWMVGLGNLGQAYLWSLASLPYAAPENVSLILQDHDRVTAENWITSILVRAGDRGNLKNKVAERWATARGFSARRIDRRLLPHDRLVDDDPRLALSGVDSIAVRKLLIDAGFDCVVDAGLGMTADAFDRFRVTVFDRNYRPENHFNGMEDPVRAQVVPPGQAYQALQNEIGTCGTVEIAGANAAAPFVSSLAAAMAVTRAIAIASGCEVIRTEVGSTSDSNARRQSEMIRPHARGVGHGGRPAPG